MISLPVERGQPKLVPSKNRGVVAYNTGPQFQRKNVSPLRGGNEDAVPSQTEIKGTAK